MAGNNSRDHLDWITLRFRDPAQEQAYQLSIADSRLKLARISPLAAIGLSSIYVVWDRLVFSDSVFVVVTFLREIVVNLVLLAAFAATWLEPLRRRCNAVTATYVLAYSVFFGGINTLEPTPYIFLANGMLIVIWPYLFITGNLPLAPAVGLSASVLFACILAVARDIDLGFILLMLLVFSTNCLGFIFAYQVELFRRRQFLTVTALDLERQRYRDLMTRVLPTPVADRLNRGESVSDVYGQVVVLFADIVGFTSVAACHTPAAIVNWLNSLFADFDVIVEKYGLEKLKTIGDAYMAAHGLHGAAADCAKCIEAALDLIALTNARQMPDGTPVQIRVGVHIGPVLAGIIGQKRFLYDLWGDTVNVASRMEAASRPGAVLVTSEVRNLLQEAFEFEECPAVPIKGKGEMTTWIVRNRTRWGDRESGSR